jgi:FkbM family methyltransferase
MLGATENICNHSFLARLINSSSVVIDLGGNKGEFAHGVIQRFQCKVVCVEPVKALYEGVQRHSLLELLPLAVGGTNQTTEMNVFSTRCASVLAPLTSAEKPKTQPIEMITLAELRRRTRAERIDLLKIDIEGAEIELFESCSDEELQSIMQITVEFHDFLYPEQQSSVATICARMRKIGFWVLPFSLDSTDVLFVNRKAGVGIGEIAYLRSVVKYGTGIGRRLRRTFASAGSAGASLRRPS